MEHRLTSFADVHAALCNPDLRQSLYDAGEVIMKDVLLTLHGEEHKRRRHLELRLFRRNYAYHYETEIFPKTLARVLDPAVDEGETDLVDFGYRVTMNLTADFAGIDRPVDSPQETDKLLAIVKTFSEGATLVHSERNRDTVIEEVNDAKTAFADFLLPSKERREKLLADFREGKIPEEDLPRDVLTVLLRNQDNIQLSDALIEREIGFYLQAGSHSTANAMVHAIHEVFNWSESPRDLLGDPLLLQRCVHESLRLHPASPVAWRTPVGPTTLPNNQPANEGDLIVLDLETANRDPTVFGDDAPQFNPNRQLRHPRASAYGLSFGTGVHMCTGRDLDGGVAASNETDAEAHQYGIVSKLIIALLKNDMRLHPHKAAVADSNTSRTNWGYYPVVFAS